LQPLFLASWRKAPKKFQRSVDWAIAEAEMAAAQGHTTPDLKAAGMAAMDAYAARPMDVVVAGGVAFAAAHSSFGAQLLEVGGARFVLEKARWAVRYFEQDHGVKGAEAAATKAIWDDLQHLRRAARREKWTDRTPVAPGFFGPLWPKGRPRSWPAQASAPRTIPAKRRRPSLAELCLPGDLVEFLKAGRELSFEEEETETGRIGLKPLHHLKFDDLTVTTLYTPLEGKDPHRGEEGDYLLRVVDLIAECERHHPEGLLAWFSDYRMFGSWDPDHHTAIGFPKASWSDIVADAATYLNAERDADERVARQIVPWKHCKFVKRRRRRRTKR